MPTGHLEQYLPNGSLSLPVIHSKGFLRQVTHSFVLRGIYLYLC